MANPITWRNINAPSFTGVAQSMRNANDAFTTGSNQLQEALGSIVDNRQALGQSEIDAINQNALLEISRLKDLSTFDNDSQKILNNYASDPRINQQKLMDSISGRKSSIMENITKQNAFDSNQATLQGLPVFEEVKQRLISGELVLPNEINSLTALTPQQQTELLTLSKEKELTRNNSLFKEVINGSLLNSSKSEADYIAKVRAAESQGGLGDTYVPLTDQELRNRYQSRNQLDTEQLSLLDRMSAATAQAKDSYLVNAQNQLQSELTFAPEQLTQWTSGGSPEEIINNGVNQLVDNNALEINWWFDDDQEDVREALFKTKEDIVNKYNQSEETFKKGLTGSKEEKEAKLNLFKQTKEMLNSGSLGQQILANAIMRSVYAKGSSESKSNYKNVVENLLTTQGLIAYQETKKQEAGLKAITAEANRIEKESLQRQEELRNTFKRLNKEALKQG